MLKTAKAEIERRRTENRLKHYAPYTKQRAFHDAGVRRERLFLAGNQLGKTWAGAFEAAMHATGLYPDWWKGRRWDKATVGWAGGVTGLATRDTIQRLLLGRPGQFGTGTIPKEKLEDTTSARGVPDLVDTIHVRHVSGKVSTIGLKSYEMGREKWQGETLDYVWFDEEPPEDIYMEGITRTNATGGMVWMTFTPLLGMSEVVRRFLLESSPSREVVTMTIDDAEHYTPEQRAEIIASYPAHEREARTKGIPTLGSGLIFPVVEDDIIIDPIDIPRIWPRIGGMDFGYDHPFGAAKLAWDRDNDVIYVTADYRQREATPIIHSAALKAWGATLPWAWPHDGLQHDKGSGEQLAEQYRSQGLSLLHERATFDDGTNGVEAGLSEMLQRMQTGRWKVFRNCQHWLEERRLYHRKDGKVVKERDDVISASRYAMMMLRYAATDHPMTRSRPRDGWVA